MTQDIAKRIHDESERDLRNAIQMGQVFDQMFGVMGLKEEKKDKKESSNG